MQTNARCNIVIMFCIISGLFNDDFKAIVLYIVCTNKSKTSSQNSLTRIKTKLDQTRLTVGRVKPFYFTYTNYVLVMV